MKLRTKFFLIFFAIAAVPILLISSVAYYRYYSTTQRQMAEYSANIFSKALQQTSQTMDEVNRAADLFTYYSDGNNSLIQNLKPYAKEDADTSPLAIYQTKQNIKYLCSNILNSYDFIYGLYVFTPSGVTLNYDGSSPAKLRYRYEPAGEPWFEQTMALDGRLYVSDLGVHRDMFQGDAPSVFFAKRLYDIYSHQYLGVLLIHCSPQLFDLDNLNTLPDIVSFELTGDDGRLIWRSWEGEETPDAFRMGHVLSSPIAGSPLTLTSATNYSRLYQEFNVTGLILVSIALACLAACLVLAFVLSHYLTRPITVLSGVMSSQRGSSLLPASRYQNRRDEIGVLYKEYDRMVEKLNLYIKNEYQNKLITLDAQMKSLEARINSHFLFNTLASITSLAELDGSDRLAEMSIALGNMFRYAIKTESELVSVREELGHVRDYVTIQSLRYDGAFTFENRIPERLLSCRVLKLILQPLVENAFLHGIQSGQTGHLIAVDGRAEAPFLYLTVSDDGRGIEPEKLARLRASLREEAAFTELGHRNNRGIGIRNIDSRIRLYYGEEYGLSIESREGEGTAITIRLPLADGETRPEANGGVSEKGAL